jgi:hypothetical protein
MVVCAVCPPRFLPAIAILSGNGAIRAEERALESVFLENDGKNAKYCEKIVVK